MNKVIISGNLTRDPELSYTPNQTAICKFGIANNRKCGDREETAFVDCTAWGKQAEIINQHFGKGKAILLEGRVSFDQWEGKDGQRRTKLYVTVEGFDFIGAKDDQPGPPQGQRQPAPPMGGGQAPPPLQAPTPDDSGDSQIPF